MGFVPLLLISFQAVGKAYPAAVSVVLGGEVDGEAVVSFVQSDLRRGRGERRYLHSRVVGLLHFVLGVNNQ